MILRPLVAAEKKFVDNEEVFASCLWYRSKCMFYTTKVH